MHVALVDVAADAGGVGAVAGVAEAAVAGLEVFARAVRAHAGHLRALVDVRTAIVLARAGRAQRRVIVRARRRASLA